MAMTDLCNPILAALDLAECRSVDQLVDHTGFGRRGLVKAVCVLIARGLAERRERGCYVLSEAGAAFLAGGGRVTSGPNGPHTSSRPKSRKRPTHRDRVWLAIRIRRKFGMGDLLELIDDGTRPPRQGYANIRTYVAALTQAGLLVELPVRAEGTAPTSNGFKRWALVDDPGPAAPIWRAARGEVFDPNRGETRKIGGAP